MTSPIENQNSKGNEVELPTEAQVSESEMAKSTLSLEATSEESIQSDLEQVDAVEQDSSVVETASVESVEAESVLPKVELVKEATGESGSAKKTKSESAAQENVYIGKKQETNSSVEIAASAQGESTPVKDQVETSTEAKSVVEKVVSDLVQESDVKADLSASASDSKPTSFAELLENNQTIGSKAATSFSEDLFQTRQEFELLKDRGETEKTVERFTSRTMMAKSFDLGSVDELNRADFNQVANRANLLVNEDFAMTLDQGSIVSPKVRLETADDARSYVVAREVESTGERIASDLRTVETRDISAPVVSEHKPSLVVTDSDAPVLSSDKTIEVVANKDIPVVSNDKAVVVAKETDAPVIVTTTNAKPTSFAQLIEAEQTTGSEVATSLSEDLFQTREETKLLVARGETEDSVNRFDSRTTMAKSFNLGSVDELNNAEFNSVVNRDNLLTNEEFRMSPEKEEVVVPKVRLETAQIARSFKPEVEVVTSEKYVVADSRPAEETREPASIPALDSMKVVRAENVVTSGETDTPETSRERKTEPELFESLINDAPVAVSTGSTVTSLAEEKFITKGETAVLKERGETNDSVERLNTRTLMAHSFDLGSTQELNTAEINHVIDPNSVVASGELKIVRARDTYKAPVIEGPKLVVDDSNLVASSSSDRAVERKDSPIIPALETMKVVTNGEVVTSNETDRPEPSVERKAEPELFASLIKEAPVAVSTGTTVTSLAEEKFITKGETAVLKERGETNESVERLNTRTLMAHSFDLGSTQELNTAEINHVADPHSVVASGELKMVRARDTYTAPVDTTSLVATSVSDRSVERDPSSIPALRSMKVVTANDVVNSGETDKPGVSGERNTEPELFASLLKDAPVAVSNRTTVTSLSEEKFITKGEVAVLKERGETNESVERLNTRTLMAHSFDLNSTQELNTAELNRGTGPVSVVASGELKMTRSPSEYKAPELHLVSTERVENPSHVTRLETKPTSFEQLIAAKTTTGSKDATSLSTDLFQTRAETNLLKERGETEETVTRFDSRTVLAKSFDLNSTDELNRADFNSVSNRNNLLVNGEFRMTSQPTEVVNPRVKLVSAEAARDPLMVAHLLESEKPDAAKLASNNSNEQTIKTVQTDIVQSEVAKVRTANSIEASHLVADTENVDSRVKRQEGTDEVVKPNSVGYEARQIESSNLVANNFNFRASTSLLRTSSQPLVGSEVQPNVTKSVQPLSEVIKAGTKSFTAIDSTKSFTSVGKSSTISNNSSFDYSSVKRVAETVVSQESSKAIASYSSVVSGLGSSNIIPFRTGSIQRVDSATSIATTDLTAPKVSGQNSATNVLTGSIIDSTISNTASVKLSGVTRSTAIAIGQVDGISIDSGKGISTGIVRLEGIKIGSADRATGSVISISSRADAAVSSIRVDGKVINLSLDGMINISKIDVANAGSKFNGVQHINVVPSTNSTGKVDVASGNIKPEATASGAKTEATSKSDSNVVKSVDATIATAKTFVTSSTAPALIAAIKYGEPLPEGMTYENGFVKLTHNGQVLYFPGLRAALKFVEGLGAAVEEDDEEWYVQKLDAEGNSSRVPYIVVPGDTIESICEQRLGDARYRELLITINRSEIVYRSLDGAKVPFVYPSQVIMLPSRYECKVFRKNFFGANANEQTQDSTKTRCSRARRTDSIYNVPASTPDKLLAKLHKEVVDHYGPKTVDASKKSGQNPVSGPLGMTIERVRFAGGKESVNLSEYRQSIGQLSQSKFHEVKDGDTLLTIALKDKNLGDTRFWKLIAKVNGLTTRLDAFGIPCEALVPGQHLLVPDRKQIVEFCLQESIPTPKLENEPISAIQFSPSDTVVTSEVEVKTYAENCRATIASSPASQNDFTINLQLKIDDSWVTVSSYQSRNGKTVRSTYTKDGVNSTMVIDLPATIVKEMAYEEFGRSWQLRCGMFKSGKAATIENRVPNGEKKAFVSDVF